MKVKDPKTGKMIKGQVVKVVKAVEPFSYITLEDGTEVTVRTNVTQVVRLLDQWNEGGAPVYQITANSTITFNSPDEIRRPV